MNQYADQNAKADLDVGYEADNWVKYAVGKSPEQVGEYAALKAAYDEAKDKNVLAKVDELTEEYIKATKDVMGARYALQVYNTSTFKKAQEAKSKGVSYDDYLDAFLAQKGVTSDKDKNGNTIYLSSSTNKKDAIDEVTSGMSAEEKEVLYELFDISKKVW